MGWWGWRQKLRLKDSRDSPRGTELLVALGGGSCASMQYLCLPAPVPSMSLGDPSPWPHTSPFSLRILRLNSLPSRHRKSSPGWMMPHLMAMARAVLILSPVTMRTVMPARWHLRMASGTWIGGWESRRRVPPWVGPPHGIRASTSPGKLWERGLHSTQGTEPLSPLLCQGHPWLDLVGPSNPPQHRAPGSWPPTDHDSLPRKRLPKDPKGHPLDLAPASLPGTW